MQSRCLLAVTSALSTFVGDWDGDIGITAIDAQGILLSLYSDSLGLTGDYIGCWRENLGRLSGKYPLFESITMLPF